MRREKDMMATRSAEVDPDAITISIGNPTSVFDGEDANVKNITIDDFSVSARGKQLLKNASLKISLGKRYGLVGASGMGKSTLLKLLACRKIPIPKDIDVLLVEEEFIGDDRTALEAVASANQELNTLKREVAALQDTSSDDYEIDGADGNDDAAYDFDSDYAHSQARAFKILSELGFTKDMQACPTRSFSGGWRMRISLARALFVQPTLLLLDEPTNHLDLWGVILLEEYLCRKNISCVVVSHDREFLNNVCNQIIHLHDMKLYFYRGNYNDFERRIKMKKKYKIYDKLKQTKASKRLGRKAEQETVKCIAKAASKKNRGKTKVDEAAPAPEAPQKWVGDYTVEFHFPEPTELTPPLLQLNQVTFSYPNRENFKLSNVDVGIDMGTHVAIVGPNGSGKSTLLDLLSGDLVASEGEVRRSQNLRIARYSQHFVDLLTMDETPVQYLLRLHPGDEGSSKQEEAVCAELEKFGLHSHDDHLTPIGKLSGGEKARVAFTSMSMSKPHILILDEPTNHLDMQSIDALGDALDEFNGGVVLVSYDSRLLSKVCKNEETSELWLVQYGTVKVVRGSFVAHEDKFVKEFERRLSIDPEASIFDIKLD